MLKEAAGIRRVVLKTGRTDLRRGIDGLKAAISLNGMDPLEKAPATPHLKVSRKYLDSLMPWSEEYKSYETQQKKELLETCLPPSDVEPTGRKHMKYTA